MNSLLISLIFFSLYLNSSIGLLVGENATLSSQSLGKILCSGQRLKTSDYCKNLTEKTIGSSTRMHDQSTQSITTINGEILPITDSPITKQAMTVTLQALLSAMGSIVIYIIIVLGLKFRLGLSWQRALAMGLRRGHLCPCVFHLHINAPAIDAFEMQDRASGNA